jgi:ribosome-binding factor A
METMRQKKFAREMQRELGQLLQREVDPATQSMVSVSHIHASPDLQHLRVYLTCFPDKNLPLVLNLLNEEKAQLRKLLSQRVKHQVRHVPTMEFFEDDTLKTANRLDRLFDRIRPAESDAPAEEAPALAAD